MESQRIIMPEGVVKSDGAIRQAPLAGDVVAPKRRCGPRCSCLPDLGPMREFEGPSEDDVERFSGVTRACRSCRTELRDDARSCWACGTSLDERRLHKLPTWAAVAAGLAVVGIVMAVLLV